MMDLKRTLRIQLCINMMIIISHYVNYKNVNKLFLQ